MKIALWATICGCVLVCMGCIIAANFMFDIRASGLVFAAIMAIIGVFLGIDGLDDFDNSGEDASDD